MVCDVTAPLDLDHVDTSGGEEIGCQQHVIAFSLASERDHGLVLNKNPCIGLAALSYGVVQRMLKLPYLAVGALAEVEETRVHCHL
jgi:hypothetical protein